jgi:hypothetical protein
MQLANCSITNHPTHKAEGLGTTHSDLWNCKRTLLTSPGLERINNVLGDEMLFHVIWRHTSLLLNMTIYYLIVMFIERAEVI